MDLPPGVVRWVEEQLGAPVDGVTRLAGATSSAVHLVRAGSAEAVLRRYTNARWLAREPYLAEREAAVLEQLAPTSVPAPRLLAVDAHGRQCDVPAVLMTSMPGIAIADADPARLGMAAEHLAALHAVSEVPAWPFRRYNPDPGLPPPWSARPDLWERAFAALSDPVPGSPPRFIHRDFHYGNLLWDGDRLGAVVDWVNACAGPPGIDVARFRLNLALDLGPAEARAFEAAYLQVTGVAHDPRWDVVDAVDMLPYYEGDAAVAKWPGGAWPIAARSRLEAFLGAALSRL